MKQTQTVTLCGGGCASCPQATFTEDGGVVLRADDGQQVTLTAFQFGMLYAEAAKQGALGCPEVEKEG